jgi:ATP synthase protein I
MSRPDEHDPLVQGVRRQQALDEKARREGEPSVGRRLGQIGVLGWIVVAPILIGVAIGRWLDGVFHSGLQWTAPLLLLGVVVGCWSAWRWVQNA